MAAVVAGEHESAGFRRMCEAVATLATEHSKAGFQYGRGAFLARIAAGRQQHEYRHDAVHATHQSSRNAAPSSMRLARHAG